MPDQSGIFAWEDSIERWTSVAGGPRNSIDAIGRDG